MSTSIQNPIKPHRFAQILRRLRFYARRSLPGIFPDPERAADLAYFHAEDAAENSKTSPPENEKISLHALWAVEFYSPSQVEHLLVGFKKLGWENDGTHDPDRNPIRWVTQLRATRHGGGWLNLGTIRRELPSGPHFGFRLAPLPENVDYANGKIFTLTSSITCVVIQFVFNDAFSESMDVALRTPRETFFENHGRGYSIIQPEHQKLQTIQQIRSGMRLDAWEWFQANLPGLFSANDIPGEFPTCELVTTREREPFEHIGNGKVRSPEYINILGFDASFDAWVTERIPGLKFGWPLLRDHDNKYHAVLAAKEVVLDNEAIKSYGSLGRHAYAAYINSHIETFLTRWALVALLSSLQRQINAARDSADLRSSKGKRSLAVLSTLTDLVLRGVDIAAISSELIHFTDSTGRFEHDVEKMQPIETRFHRENTELRDNLKRIIAEQATWLQSADRNVRDLLIQYGSVLATRENIRLQRTMGRLTLLIIVLSVAVPCLVAIAADHAGRGALWMFATDCFAWVRRIFSIL